MSRKGWSFIHYTDIHVQPELRGDEGYRQAVRAMNALKPQPAFAIAGGDLVFDAFDVGYERADNLFTMYSQITQGLDMPSHATLGNHDVFGVGTQSGVSLEHPERGKAMFAKRIGKGATYRSFDFRDWHFVLLDSIAITEDRDYEGRIDNEQLAWLENDLKDVGAKRPVVLVSHIPFFSIFPTLEAGPLQPVSPGIIVTNGKEVFQLCSRFNIRLILQGHLHIVEDHRYVHTQYITSGAVCGNWWKGPRNGHREGFAVYTIEGDEVRWSYQSYGWQAATS